MENKNNSMICPLHFESVSEANRSLADLAETAKVNGDWSKLVDVAGQLEKREQYKLAWSYLAAAGRTRAVDRLPEWSGDWSATGTILVYRHIRHVGAELRMARFMHHALRRGLSLVAWADPRLVPLFQRSFPGLEVVSRAETIPEADYATSFENLAQHTLASNEDLAASFLPLISKPFEAADSVFFPSPRRRLTIGIAWHSTNGRKELPPLSAWIEFLSGLDANIFCLQYRSETCGLADLIQALGSKVSHLSEIDQMLDLDGFSSLVEAMDVVVTISNTTAHMAGALGKRCIVILDDKNHLMWPECGSRTPFYPDMTLVRPLARGWREVFVEVRKLLGAGPGSPRK